jgi:hypothetical protein
MADPRKSGKQTVPSRPLKMEDLAAQKLPHGGDPYHGPDGRFSPSRDSVFDRLTPEHPHVELPPGASIRLVPETPQTHMHRIPPLGNKAMPRQKRDVEF